MPWAQLVAEVESCRACPLHAHREHVVVYRGAAHPWVVFVGEAPGAEEDRAGRPFVGRAGRRLDAAIDVLALGPEEVGILNLIKCRPPGNRFDRRAATACRPFLDRQLALLGPKLLVPLGAHALQALVPGAPRVTTSAGHLIEGDGTAIFPLLHPAAAMHAPGYRERWEKDVRTLARTLAHVLEESL
ncbi:MAG: uracil-DNA glycosylase [Thermoplasmata archaeon]